MILGLAASAVKTGLHRLSKIPGTYQSPRDPSTFSEGVWGGFGGSRCLLRRYLDP